MKWDVYKRSEEDRIFVTEEGEQITVALKPRQYACVKFESETYPCRENMIYRVVSDIPTEGMRCKLIANWYRDGKVKARRYINGEGETVSPGEVDHVSFTILINGSKDLELCFSSCKLEEAGEYRPNPVKLAAVSLDEKFRNDHKGISKEAFLARYEELIDEAGAKKPDLILLSEEYHVTDFSCAAWERSVTMEDEAVKLMQRKAVQFGCYVAGTIQRQTDGHYYNTALIFDRNGNLMGKYDKTHLTLMEYENGVTPGEDLAVFDTDFGRVGFSICWDLYFPLQSQILYRKGVKLLLNPTLAGGFTQAYAASAASGMFMLVSNGYDSKWSRIQSPKGEVIAEVKEGHVLVETVDLNEMYFTSMLSVGADGEGRNLFITEARNDLYKEFFSQYENVKVDR